MKYCLLKSPYVYNRHGRCSSDTYINKFLDDDIFKLYYDRISREHVKYARKVGECINKSLDF